MEKSFEVNRSLWDTWAKVHEPSAFYDVDGFVADPSDIRVSHFEREELGEVSGKRLLHLQCHIGLDTLSWARLGADVTGADFSEESLAAANRLAERTGQQARWIRCDDIYRLGDVLDETFDIVYTSRGVLGWLPDIARWADMAASFVAPGGILYVNEAHPIAMAWDDDDGVALGALQPRYQYWEHVDPIVHIEAGSYADPTADTGPLEEHGWNHSLGEIVTAVARTGLRIESLRERPFLEWQAPFTVATNPGWEYRLPGDLDGKLPLSFSLKARRDP